MLPHTSALIESLRSRRRDEVGMLPDDGIAEEAAERLPVEDPQYYQLVMKKRRQTQMLKEMMQRGGYGDLAKMTAFTKEDLGEDDNGY